MTLVKNNQFNLLIDELFNQTHVKVKDAYVQNHVPANILEHENAYELIVSAPGRLKEDFALEVNDGILVISYAPKNTSNESNLTSPKYVRREFTTQAFKRCFTLDDKIDTDKIGAKYENGLLLVQLPKKETLNKGNKLIAVS